MKTVKKNIKSNQGFSLVELIIVIAILAILAGAIAISVIRYINKARKSNDINAAEAIGKSFQNACIKDETMFDYLTEMTTDPELPEDERFRVLAYARAVSGHGNADDMDFHLTDRNSTSESGLDDTKIMEEYLGFLTDSLTPVKFKKAGKLDQWVICSDAAHNIHVYVGSGTSESDKYMDDDGKIGSRQYYELWPEQNPEYERFSIPSDVP